MKELLSDERIWTIAARVEKHKNDSEHYEMTDEGHMVVSVITLRHGVPIKAILNGGGNNGHGVWFIPPIGTEVVVNFDDGQFEGDAYIVGIHGHAPSALEPGKVLIRGDVVNLCDADENPLTGEGVVIGTGIDPFTGQTYNALQNASTKVFAKK
jgi:hypothetical protein